jgi:hypothetical protein
MPAIIQSPALTRVLADQHPAPRTATQAVLDYHAEKRRGYEAGLVLLASATPDELYEATVAFDADVDAKRLSPGYVRGWLKAMEERDES